MPSTPASTIPGSLCVRLSAYCLPQCIYIVRRNYTFNPLCLSRKIPLYTVPGCRRLQCVMIHDLILIVIIQILVIQKAVHLIVQIILLIVPEFILQRADKLVTGQKHAPADEHQNNGDHTGHNTADGQPFLLIAHNLNDTEDQGQNPEKYVDTGTEQHQREDTEHQGSDAKSLPLLLSARSILIRIVILLILVLAAVLLPLILILAAVLLVLALILTAVAGPLLLIPVSTLVSAGILLPASIRALTGSCSVLRCAGFRSVSVL